MGSVSWATRYNCGSKNDELGCVIVGFKIFVSRDYHVNMET